MKLLIGTNIDPHFLIDLVNRLLPTMAVTIERLPAKEDANKINGLYPCQACGSVAQSQSFPQNNI